MPSGWNDPSFYFSPSGGCEVVTCAFNWHFSGDSWCFTHFHVLIGLFCIFCDFSFNVFIVEVWEFYLYSGCNSMSKAPIENMLVTYFLKQSIAFDEQNMFPCYCLGEMITFLYLLFHWVTEYLILKIQSLNLQKLFLDCSYLNRSCSYLFVSSSWIFMRTWTRFLGKWLLCLNCLFFWNQSCCISALLVIILFSPACTWSVWWRFIEVGLVGGRMPNGYSVTWDRIP